MPGSSSPLCVCDSLSFGCICEKLVPWGFREQQSQRNKYGYSMKVEDDRMVGKAIDHHSRGVLTALLFRPWNPSPL